MAERNKPEVITKAKVLLVEGQDEVNLFNELLAELALGDDIQVLEVGGTDKFMKELLVHRFINSVTYLRSQSIGV